MLPNSTTAYFGANATANSPLNNDAGGHGKSSWIRRFLVCPERSRGTFTLMTEEEMEYLRLRREEDGDEARVILATRPTRSLLKGLAGSALNVLLSFFISPLLALSVSLDAIRLGGPRPVILVVAPIVGVTWGAVFFLIAWYAALQQLLLSVFYQLQAPVMLLGRPGCCWDGLACRYGYPSGVAGSVHPSLAVYATHERLREQAQKREFRRRRNAKRDATYDGVKSRKSGGSDNDYYAVLGVERDATTRQVKEAYNRLVLELHPDKNPNKSAASQFDAVTTAYRVLGNAEKRRKYDIGGTSVLEDIGEKKRDAVRALFGGEALYTIVGDVKTGSFSQRVVDGLDWTQDELAACRQRMLQRCRDELLTFYLQPLQNHGTNAGNCNDGIGLADVKRRLQGLLNTGLAKEVLCAVGQEYMRVVRYSEATNPLQRLRFFLHVMAPHRVQRRLDKWRALGRIRQHTFKDSAAMVDLAWYTSVEELESTARWVATAVLLDPHLPLEERQRRRDALRVIAETFIVYGQIYKGANRQTMDTLMNSLQEYKQQQRRRDGQ
ncbi:hypothetical protein TRSC58_00873 [Trypanosoma rangeli SC58]|uniref:J domain-containing protein n=1 Tax=Trypanosoma rangeli SC58 TaxID=429131 RepID=A0A061J7G4_TRYRA|nr:hypothetical protein TRSC58_00873 [Trypanosoma rangeli SC58]